MQCGLCLAGGSMKSFGVARARYDFSARDRSELSLREGDTIKILKKGHSGWWKGEVYGRVRTSNHTGKMNYRIWGVSSHLFWSCVFRWGYFQPTMWKRTILTTADIQRCVGVQDPVSIVCINPYERVLGCERCCDWLLMWIKLLFSWFHVVLFTDLIRNSKLVLHSLKHFFILMN